MKKILVSPLAERDLVSIWRYIAEKSGSTDIANSFIDLITEHFSILRLAPEAGTRRDGIEQGLRGFPVRDYIIYYRERGSSVIISRVIHGSREQAPAFRESSE